MKQLCVCCNVVSVKQICVDCDLAIISCQDPSPSMNAFFYKSPVADLIGNFKYKQDLLAAKVLARYAAKIFSGMWQQYDAIMPMPVNKKRLSDRGMHCTDYLLRLIMHYSCKPLPMVNTYNWRPVLSRAQQQLSYKDRLQNITPEHFFLPKLGFARCLVFDDVITTGTTWCALQAASDNKIELISLASAQKQ